ncbi:tRNA (adenosine(37)-N6)-threonylcarbamoyltransferase complex dimerization subunit type 1 TsaB [Candidatus Peregrinibacteria bacterium]|nr:tRNA (adenosine(37)-N6)-threonylcarbamoyltransferase complex dimerization subunit type 1 TsaB [Candidatus Peregrinibacteria bacterium]
MSKSLRLAINTSATVESVALLDGKKLLAETVWKSKMDETERLLKNIEKLLKRAGKRVNDVDAIIVACGPGPFSAVRIGVTVSNILANSLSIPIYSLNTQVFWKNRLKSEQIAARPILLLHAGGHFVNLSGHELKEEMLPIKDVLALVKGKFAKKSLVFFGDLTENEAREFDEAKEKNWEFIHEKNLKTFGETVAALPASKFKKQKIAIPVYWKPANITKFPKAKHA